MLESCTRPELITEITLQPLRRYDVDAAILFSDIVVPLRAVGIDVDIKAGIGPVIENTVRTARDLERLRPLEPDEDKTWVTVEQFEQVLDAAVGRPDVRITFDDGNASDVEIALPRLVDRGLTGEFCEIVLHRLEFRDRLLEGDALAGISDADIEHRFQRARDLQAAHHAAHQHQIEPIETFRHGLGHQRHYKPEFSAGRWQQS